MVAWESVSEQWYRFKYETGNSGVFTFAAQSLPPNAQRRFREWRDDDWVDSRLSFCLPAAGLGCHFGMSAGSHVRHRVGVTPK